MIMNSCEIWHWGVKGMKWGVRRYRNADGSLTPEGVRKYRKSYNDIKNTQKLAERSKTVNSTGISALDSYNNKYYEKQARTKVDALMSRIGKRGFSQIDKQVVSEGKRAAEKVKKEAERFNATLDLNLDTKDSFLLLRNPKKEYDAPNSTMQQLVRKLALLDVVDEQAGSGKLDMIIQLPYVIKSPARREQAEQRRADIEQQLSGSKYGIAYTDGTERIVQLNRSLENNILKSIEYLTNMVYSQLGVTQEILNGTADEKTMNNYMNRIIEPVVSAIADEFKRKFLTKTARTQGQSIMFFRDPFRLAPVSMISEMADKFTRNEIMTPNELRQVIGMKPSKDPKSDKLANRNIASADEKMPM